MMPLSLQAAQILSEIIQTLTCSMPPSILPEKSCQLFILIILGSIYPRDKRFLSTGKNTVHVHIACNAD